MNYLSPIIGLNRNQISALNPNDWCIFQDLSFNGYSYLYLMVCAPTLQGFKSRREALAVLTKYGVRNTRENSQQVRVGVFTIREVANMFMNKAYQVVGVI